MKASEIKSAHRLELLVEGLYGPKSRRWVPIREVWRGIVKGKLGDPKANVNFSLAGLGWLTYPHDAELTIRRNNRLG